MLLLLRSPAAIDGDRRAGDLICRSRTQEGNGAAKLRRSDEIQRRLLLGEQLPGGFLLTDASLRSGVADLSFDERRSHPSGTDCVAGHATSGSLEADDLGQANQPVLGRDIGGLMCR